MELKKKKRHYSKGVIRAVLGELKAGHSRSEVCAKWGVSKSSVSTWVLQYADREVVETVRRSFTQQQRRFIVAKIQVGELTVAEAAIAHQTSRSTIKHWMNKNEPDNIDIDLKESTMPVHNPVHDELQKARLKILALETMIDVAEAEYKIKIRKKSGARQ